MVDICCTQKLLKELAVDLDTDKKSVNIEHRWHANVFTIERRKCVLAVHDQTLFSVFMPGFKKAQFKQFTHIFGQSVFKQLLNFNFNQQSIETMLSRLSESNFDKSRNRSVMGSMNDMRFNIEHIVSQTGLVHCDLNYIHQLINKMPFSAIKYAKPYELMKIYLGEVIVH